MMQGPGELEIVFVIRGLRKHGRYLIEIESAEGISRHFIKKMFRRIALELF
jgi:hypothetical protein